MKKILLTLFVLFSTTFVFAQDDYKVPTDAYFNQRVVQLTKAGTLEQTVMELYGDVHVQGIKVTGPMNDADLKFLARLAKGGSLTDLHSANLHDAEFESIPEGCFQNLTYFMYIYFPKTLRTISDNAFQNCDLISVVLNNGLESIGKHAFYSTHSKTLTIPASVKYIGDAAFAGSKDYTEVKVDPANTIFKMIGYMLCDVSRHKVLQCFNMSEGIVEVPQDMESIGDEAFSPLKKVTAVRIPASVTHIGSEVFSMTYALQKIEVASENPSFTAVDGVLFSKDRSVLWTYPASKDGKSYTTPATVRQIADGAFAQAGGQNAHAGMKGKEKREKNLARVTVNEGTETIGKDAFLFSGLEEIELPKTIRSIGSSCFYYTDLSRITLPEGITRLEDATFGACGSLESVTLPSTLTYIGNDIFAVYNTSLTDVSIYAPEPPTCAAGAFNTFDNSVTLHVVGGAERKYEQDDIFGSSLFDSIVGDLTPTSVKNVTKRATDVVETGIYSIDGRKLQHRTRGLNIIKMSDGSARKVLADSPNQ
ncbi:MAG: leucine-rich repeat domain-containing protein [Prevotella multiformis]|uniref:leucine-rich repeat domain-containing protein n=1 Tax=Prevotella multiformis TaxID=282402 RepID=UPI003FA18371